MRAWASSPWYSSDSLWTPSSQKAGRQSHSLFLGSLMRRWVVTGFIHGVGFLPPPNWVTAAANHNKCMHAHVCMCASGVQLFCDKKFTCNKTNDAHLFSRLLICTSADVVFY